MFFRGFFCIKMKVVFSILCVELFVTTFFLKKKKKKKNKQNLDRKRINKRAVESMISWNLTSYRELFVMES
jgi:hypothetical protein